MLSPAVLRYAWNPTSMVISPAGSWVLLSQAQDALEEQRQRMLDDRVEARAAATKALDVLERMTDHQLAAFGGKAEEAIDAMHALLRR